LSDNYDKVVVTILSLVSRLAQGDKNIDEETVLQAELGLTSLQVMELVLEVEEEFDISFPLNRLPDIRTVKELAVAIVAVLNQ
jgi:acyl carrier protein